MPLIPAELQKTVSNIKVSSTGSPDPQLRESGVHKTVTCTHKTLLHCSWQINTVTLPLKATQRKITAFFSESVPEAASENDVSTSCKPPPKITQMNDEVQHRQHILHGYTPVERIIKFPAAAVHSIKSLMCKFRATCHVCPEPERSARTLHNPSQHRGYSKRIISPIP